MTSFGSVLRSLDWSYLTDLLIQLIPALLCIMIHEICHGAAAYALGDRTAATQGRLSLNPLQISFFLFPRRMTEYFTSICSNP